MSDDHNGAPTLDYQRPEPRGAKRRGLAATRTLTIVGVAAACYLLFAMTQHGGNRFALLLAQPAASLVFFLLPMSGFTTLIAIVAVIAQWAMLGCMIDGFRLLFRRG